MSTPTESFYKHLPPYNATNDDVRSWLNQWFFHTQTPQQGHTLRDSKRRLCSTHGHESIHLLKLGDGKIHDLTAHQIRNELAKEGMEKGTAKMLTEDIAEAKRLGARRIRLKV